MLDTILNPILDTISILDGAGGSLGPSWDHPGTIDTRMVDCGTLRWGPTGVQEWWDCGPFDIFVMPTTIDTSMYPLASSHRVRVTVSSDYGTSPRIMQVCFGMN